MQSTDHFLDGECIRVEVLPPQRSCPPGTVAHGSVCARLEKQMPEAYCDRHFELLPDGSGCARRNKPIKEVCPPGFSAKHGQCTKTLTTAAMPSCEEGYRLDTSDGKDDPICVLSEVVPPEVTCPKHFELQGNICIQSDSIEAPYAKCPAGYRSRGDGTCVARQHVDGTPTCEVGVLSDDGHCLEILSEPLVPRCRKDFEFVGHSCVRRTTRAARMECPQGFRALPNGQCVRRQKLHPNTLCPQGAIMKHGGCQLVVEAPAEPSCKGGQLSSDGLCSRRVKEAPVKVCPPGTTRKDKQCRATDSIPAITTCPPGSTLDGHYCHIYEKIPGTVRCPHGSGSPHTSDKSQGCNMKETVRADRLCPAGWKAHGGQCVSSIEEPAKLLCPPGAVQVARKCEVRYTSPPTLSCPAEHLLTAEGTCLETNVVTPLLKCPATFTLNAGKCVQLSAPMPHKKKHLQA
eukprot:GHVT01102819.1.p1 GENE.GHVT01102819.1~~GHVT01102819.1.p1  ORF type:complete len:459 (-),score=72.97 GHVT01102819.1:553-1929(-)